MDSYMYVRSVALYRTVVGLPTQPAGSFFFFPLRVDKNRSKKNREMSIKEGYEEAKKQNKEKEK